MRFRRFVDERIAPEADAFDEKHHVPDALLDALAEQGWLGAIVPPELGGAGMDMQTFGLLQEEVGRGSASIHSLLTVHSMVTLALLRHGTADQKQQWLPRMARGECVAGFALTEPEAGSDAKNTATRAVPAPDSYELTGRKTWISFGERADVYLVHAESEGQSATFLVERSSAGLSITPTRDSLGFRAAMLAEVGLEGCRVPGENRVGPLGAGFPMVVAGCLDLGRYSVACGAVGLAQACLEASLHRANTRRQFGKRLAEQQLVQRMLSRMMTHVAAARLLCRRAGQLRDTRDPRAIPETLMAKYFAATVARESASDAVQIHGAEGCRGSSPVQRYYRDAKILEIIEGSSELLETMIAGYGARAIGT